MKKTRTIYYDTETTGVRPGKDRIVEIAAFEPACNGAPERSFCTFVHPECPIPPEATSISGITDAMVQGAPLIQEALAAFSSFCEEGAVLIAHNNDGFDRLFLESEFQRASLSMPQWIFADSLKWARKYRPDLPRHSLQVLRELYEVEANQAHRALDDCIVLYKVFCKMTDDLPIERILELLSQSKKILRMPFGKYAGKNLGDVPDSYIRWLSGSGALDKPEHAQLKETFTALGKLSSTTPP